MMDTIKNKSICPYAFRAVNILSNAEVTPCCRWIPRHSPVTESVISKSTSIVDVFQSEYFNIIRKKMLNGEKLKSCWRCYEEEDAGINSMRLWAGQHMEESTELNLEYLEIESGRFCNLKCRSCNPYTSSGFHPEIKSSKFMADHFRMDVNDKMLDPKNQLNNAFLSLSRKQSQSLKYLRVTGGEPFLSEYFLEYIIKLNDWGIAKNITLEVFTNSSFFPKDKFLKVLAQFKAVNLSLSIDAIGKRSDYLRSGSDWKVIEDTARKWYRFSVENSVINFHINTTISIYNVLYLQELFDWIYTEFQIRHSNETLVHKPQYMSITNFSPDVKQKIVESLQKNKQISGQRIRERVVQFINDSRKLTKYAVPSKMKSFINITETIDKIRNENWKTVFPKLEELINGY